MARENITHVLSVLRLNTTEETTFAPYRHHFIDIDDVDDENLLEHFPTAIKFIQAGLDTGGGVLVHWLVHLFLSCLVTTCLKPLGFLSFSPVRGVVRLVASCLLRHYVPMKCDLHVAGIHSSSTLAVTDNVDPVQWASPAPLPSALPTCSTSSPGRSRRNLH
jgi:hypothetical protein